MDCIVVGAYPSHADMSLNSKKDGFFVRGPVDAEGILSSLYNIL